MRQHKHVIFYLFISAQIGFNTLISAGNLHTYLLMFDVLITKKTVACHMLSRLIIIWTKYDFKDSTGLGIPIIIEYDNLRQSVSKYSKIERECTWAAYINVGTYPFPPLPPYPSPQSNRYNVAAEARGRLHLVRSLFKLRSVNGLNWLSVRLDWTTLEFRYLT